MEVGIDIGRLDRSDFWRCAQELKQPIEHETLDAGCGADAGHCGPLGWRQSMQTKAMVPSLATRAAFDNVSARKAVNSAVDISPEATANSRCRIEPSPETWPSIGTL